MILDAGTVSIYRVSSDAAPGDMYNDKRTHLITTWFGYRTVGFNRFFTAHQANTKIDTVIRILKPGTVNICADDVCELNSLEESNHTYRIVQAQYLRDEAAGEDVVDLSLERVGAKYDS